MDRLPYDPVASSRRHWIDQGWDEAADGVAAVVSLMRGWQLCLNEANDVLRPLGLTFARYQILGLLRGGERISLGQVGARLWVTPGTVTSSVGRLEAAGLLRRAPDPNDGRTVLADITPKGSRVFDEAVAQLNKGLFSSLPLSTDELAHLVGLMNKLRAAAGDTVGEAPS